MVSFEEALVFSVVFPIIDLYWRTSIDIPTHKIWEYFAKCFYSVAASEVFSGLLEEESKYLILENKDIKSTFLGRYKQYNSAYSLDREEDVWDYRLISEKLIRNVFIEFSNKKVDIPEGLHSYVSSLIDRQRARVKKALNKLDPRWGDRSYKVLF